MPRSSKPVALLAVPLLVAGYVLSEGPIVWLICKDVLPVQALIAYYPTVLARRQLPISFREAWDWYLFKWAPD